MKNNSERPLNDRQYLANIAAPRLFFAQSGHYKVYISIDHFVLLHELKLAAEVS